MRTTHAHIGGHYNKERVEDTCCGTDADYRPVVVREGGLEMPILRIGETWFQPVTFETLQRGQVWARG